MKALMYHYVREEDPQDPFFRYLHVDDFEAQLEHFAQGPGLLPRADFQAALAARTPRPGVVLTFDDGVSDHYRFAFPRLVARGAWGIFYVPSGPYKTGKLLDVHRVHVLLGRIPAGRLNASAQALIQRSFQDEAYVDEGLRAEFERQVCDLSYRQEEAEGVKGFKRLLNYFVSYAHREALIDALVREFLGAEPSAEDFYMSPAEIRDMHAQGMLIGSHSVSHRVFSRLSQEEQRQEIEDSFAFLEELTGGLGERTFCYPYGGAHTFTEFTEAQLSRSGCEYAFTVEPRDIEAADLRERPQALPRFNCNLFPHGGITYGVKGAQPG